MVIISKDKKSIWFGSSQLKSAIFYIIAVSIALLFLNIYTSNHARTMLFKSRYSDLFNTGTLLSSSLNGMESLSSEAVGQIVDLLNIDSNTSVAVTDLEGNAIFETDHFRDAYSEEPEVAKALGGKDVFRCYYRNGVTVSICAVSVMYFDKITGCVYLQNFEYDQSAMIQVLEKNLFLVSAILELAVILFALFFAFLFSRRTSKILASFPFIRSGDYSYRIALSGNDELTKLSDEFDKLTEKLENSEEIRRRFVSDASHELKTPLASIKLLGETILQNDLDSDTQKEFVSDICNEAERLNRMSQKLLQLSKMDSQIEDEKEIVSVDAVISKVYRMLEPLAKKSGIILEKSVDPSCTVLATEDDLYQVLFNLTENGIKYNRDGGKVTVTAVIEDEDVAICIKDTGLGIPENAVDHIFERFYRVDKARSRASGGSGLGLSIVHDIVVKNYGTITVSSVSGEGSSFFIRFPLFEIPPEDI